MEREQIQERRELAGTLLEQGSAVEARRVAIELAVAAPGDAIAQATLARIGMRTGLGSQSE